MPLSYLGVALTLCCLLIVSLPYLYDRTICFCLPDLSRILPSFRSVCSIPETVILRSGSRCIAAISHSVLPCLPSYSVLITHASCGPLPLLTLLTTYLSVLVICVHHVTSFLLSSYCTLVSTLRSISQPIPKPLTDPGHLIVLYLYI